MPYDYVLLDCPPAIGAITINALTAAHLLIIPTQAEYYAVHALKNMLTAVRKVRNQGNANLAYRILITMLDRRNRIHRTLSEQLRANFSGAVFQTTLEVDTRLRESSVAGLPISYHSQSTRGALQYHSLAQEIVQYAQQTTDPRTKRSQQARSQLINSRLESLFDGLEDTERADSLPAVAPTVERAVEPAGFCPPHQANCWHWKAALMPLYLGLPGCDRGARLCA